MHNINLKDITLNINPLNTDPPEVQEANNRIWGYIGRDWFFAFNEENQRYEFWEHRGPLKTMVFPLTINERPLHDITDWEIYHAVEFVRRARSVKTQENFFKYKEYAKFKEYKGQDKYYDPNTKEDLSEWQDTSPQVEGVRRVKVPVSNTVQPG